MKILKLIRTNTIFFLRLQTEKGRLNATKNKLDDKNMDLWGKHTATTLRTGDIVRFCRDELHAEMATNAWTKMYEMLVRFKLVNVSDPSSPEIKTVHVCEAPGAFICATNHYIKLNCKDAKWSWIANSLNPYYEGNDLSAMIDEDKLIVETIAHWIFGEDNTGNIMSSANIHKIWEQARSMGKIDLVTGDGSVSCIDNPNEQEEDTAPLHFSEIVCGLGCLKQGGNLVVKGFTLFEHPSICNLYLLSCLFERFSVFKPATSKAGNSETYLVGIGFKGISKEFLEALLLHVGDPSLQKEVYV